jgi:hypothetical protein
MSEDFVRPSVDQFAMAATSTPPGQTQFTLMSRAASAADSTRLQRIEQDVADG